MSIERAMTNLIFTIVFVFSVSNLVDGFTASTTWCHPAVERTSTSSQLYLGSSDICNRRSLIQQATGAASVLLVASNSLAQPAAAETYSRPYKYAPLEALLPAARVKLLIDKATKLANDMIVDNNRSTELMDALEALLLVPQNFTQSPLAAAPQQPAKQYIQSYQKGMQQLPMLAKPGAMLVQSGEIDTWKRLKRQERRREEEDEIRAALNVYTSSLAFDADTYSLSATQEERSKLVRNDQLPDIKSVIAGDMGMRYLYRNQVLTAMDSVREEVRYQRRQTGTMDATELRDLLLAAQTELNQWFSLIDQKDVLEALVAAQQ